MQPYKTSVEISSIDIATKNKGLTKNHDLTLYSIYLPKYESILHDLEKFLEVSEHNRAKKYHKEKDKNRFIISRSLLKFALAYYVQSNVESVSIKLLPNKKPYLCEHPNVYFNVSHSGDYAVIAINNTPIGIDIEYIDLQYSFQDIVSSVFNEDEIHFINHSDHKTKDFYGLWTKKEAFVKALGKGIDDDFSRIPCLDGVHDLDHTLIESSQNWQILNFMIEDENYIGAIARPLNKINNDEKLFFNTFPNSIEDLIKMNF
jgi:4'-phosphopantetheinyl transferase